MSYLWVILSSSISIARRGGLYNSCSWAFWKIHYNKHGVVFKIIETSKKILKVNSRNKIEKGGRYVQM